MTRMPLLLTALSCSLAFACAEDDDDDDSGTNTNGNTSAATANTSSNETTGDQECNSSHQCIGGACECTTAGKEMMACTDDTACEAQCEVCM